ncbi:MAG: YqaJ viral recombinase family protein [Gammaproteobacteria bacterium]|nr:YqaJ viral recombinase family protein [Gammaproteobacteria bacterium]
MIRSIHAQGTDGWFLDRCGIPTASMFSNIITSKGEASQSSIPYMHQLLAEWVAQAPVDAWKGNKFSDDGNEREPQADALYTLLTDNPVERVGLCFKDEKKLVGCSPDGLVGDDGCTEYKCPKGSTIIGYMLKKEMPSIYVPQVQGQLWVTDREWCDFLVYHPQVGHKLWHVERDERYIAQMSGRVNKFIERMLEKRELLAA